MRKIISLLALALLLSGSLIWGVTYFTSTPTWVYQVSFQGEPVGLVSSFEEYEQILEDVLQQAREQWDCDVSMNEEVRVVRVSSWDAAETNPTVVKANIADSATYTTTGWALVVDGETVVFVDSQETAEDLIQLVTAHYTSSETDFVSATIQEDVEIKQRPIQPELLMDKDSALSMLISGQEELSTYVVQRGDTLSGIARSYNTSIDRLRDANPNVDERAIQIGQVLNLETSSAILHVRTVEEEQATETIPRPVKYKPNPDMSVRAEQVLEEGSTGTREITYLVEKINGTEIKRTKQDSKVLREPQTRVILSGIGYWPNRPTGMFRFPLNQGRISSPFGPRGSGFHRGVDIATKRGTPIYAAASGTVTTRSYNSSYGYYVSIKHSGGYSTLYAHATSIADSVRVGGEVVRGQVIAWVGSTGNSTGSHLHWEVKRNGQLINPLNFFE